tara:strand:+ start:31022 stop:34297 length:3276 start_codon:yes stop_codon:yes gene_type:complete
MSIILHHRDPANITTPDRYNVETGTNLLDWMCEQWPNSEEMSNGLSTTIMLNSKVIFSTDDEVIDESLLDFTIGENDAVSIISRPGYEGLVYVVIIIVAVAISLSLAPSLPGDAGEQTESPNNGLQAASNRFRPGEATPDIYGLVVSYPDFLQPSYFEYIGNLKVVYELGYIGEGRYEVGEIRNGETPFSSIPGSSSTVYQPGEVIPTDILTIHRTANPVDGQVLLAPDDESIQQLGEIGTITGGTTTNLVLTMIEGSTIVSDLSLIAGGFLTLSDSIIYIGFNFGPDDVIGTFEIVSISIVSERTVIEIDTMTPITEAPDDIYLASSDSEGLINSHVGYFDIPGTQAVEVWSNWQMPQGIRTESGKQLSITVEFQIEILNSDQTPSGVVFTKTETVTGKTLDPQFRTTKFTQDEFPAMTASQYRMRARRITPQQDGAASQQVKLETFESITPYESLDNSTGTTISWQRRATTFAITASGNRNNLDVTRMLPTYNRATGVYDVNVISATRTFADAVAHNLITLARRNQSTVNMEGLYGILDSLPHEELGYFDFTFDNKNVGLGERIESICNAARVSPFKSGGVWDFTRDETKPIRTAMFNRRVTVGNSSKQSWLLQRPDDKDSVELSYVDPTTNTERILYRRVDSNGEIVSTGTGNQALEIKLAGCRNFFQAWNRINLEMRRIIYQRRTVTDTTLRDGMLVGLLERVGWVDPNDMNLFSGEILSFTGDNYETSERFEPVNGESYVVYITDDQGNTSNTVAAAPRNDTEFGFIASGLSGAFLAEPSGNQLGSRYFISEASSVTASDFLLTTRKPQADGRTDIELVEYVPEMYELDNANPPQSSVLLPESVTSFSVSSEPDDSTSTITVGTGGLLTASGGFSEGYIANPSTGVGVNFEARLTQVSGDEITGDNLGEWLEVSQDRAWTVTREGDNEGSNTAIATLEIRDSSFTENINSASVSISASVGGQVSLPSSITVESSGFNQSARSLIEFLSNGQYRAIGDSSTTGSYVPTSTGIGSQYEVMATLSTGSGVTGSPLGVWIGLGGSSVGWSVFADVGFNTVAANLTIQIRNITNNALTDSTSVTLRAETEL